MSVFPSLPISLSTHLLIDIRVVATSWLMWIMLQWTPWYCQISLQDLFCVPWVTTQKYCWIRGSSVFMFLSNLPAVFHITCLVLHSHQQYTSVLISHITHQCLFFLWLFLVTILTGWGDTSLWFLFAFFLMTSDMEHLCVCLLAIKKTVCLHVLRYAT